jgi:hypothetical protein
VRLGPTQQSKEINPPLKWPLGHYNRVRPSWSKSG